MKKLTLPTALFVFLLLGAGCQTEQAQQTQPAQQVPQAQEPVTSLPPAVEELQTQTVPKSEKQEKTATTTKAEPAKVGTALYRGSWFDIAYPQNFTAAPTAPTYVSNKIKRVQTDEAYFTSPDGAVEFFVYSPLWSGNPKNYLTIASTEELASDKTDQTKQNERPGQTGDRVVHWVTIKAKDGSYYRSYVSIKEQIGTGSDLHHVFGIKYKDNAAYEQYKAAYVAFKDSLIQWGD